MEWTDNLLQMSLLVGIIFAIVGTIQYVYAPKKINSLYGYRTASSMSSEERWHFAQKFSALQMIKAGVFLIVLSTLPLFVEVEISIQLIMQFGFLFLCVAYLFYSTEKAIKTRFPKN